MLTSRAEILQKLKLIKPVLQESCGITELALFGSYAREEQNDKSDVDIMVQMAEKSYKKFLKAIDILETAFIGLDVQVASKDGIKPAYFELVKSDIIYA